MKKIMIIYILILFFGAGCEKGDFSPLTSDGVRQALYGAGNSLDWAGDIIEKPASAENYYGKSYILSGPFKQGDEVSEYVLIDEMEIIEFENSAYAQISYKNEECFKGKGEPIKIYGMGACCLNDRVRGRNSVVMTRDNYILRANDYFHPDCGAAEFLKAFWKSYEE